MKDLATHRRNVTFPNECNLNELVVNFIRFIAYIHLNNLSKKKKKKVFAECAN